MKPATFFIISVVLLLSPNALAMSPQDLDQAMKSADPPTIIDVRPTHQYSRSHIPGAISIPGRLCRDKNLPPLGAVVIYGDGLLVDDEAQCLEALNGRDGITADQLDGGFSRWAALGFPVTAQAGMKPEELPFITYGMLSEAAMQNPDVLVLDLRSQTSSTRKQGEPLTDIQALFPNVRVAQSGRKASTPKIAADAKDMLILIDNGDGAAQAHARRLRAAGVHRFVILAGGEQTLASRGQAGADTIVTEIEQ